jgi:alpha-tubulin suppressor-like RCC1 family protein
MFSLNRLVLAAGSVVVVLGCGSSSAPLAGPSAGPDLATTGTPLTFYQLSAGLGTTCGVAADARAYCWGLAGRGLLGDGTLTNRSRPGPVLGGLSFRQLSVGGVVTCGVTTDYHAYCWGYNGTGAVGDGTTQERLTPALVGGGRRFLQIGTNARHTCAVGYLDRRVYCWGQNARGQLGDGTASNRLSPVRISSTRTFRQVTTGDAHSCGVTTDDVVFCWGDNRYGQVGDSTEVARRLTPTRVAGGRAYRTLDAGTSYTCSVTTGSRAFCWGDGRYGQLGTGKSYLSFWPRAVAGGHNFDRVTSGQYHSCGESSVNQIWCWGQNSQGELGDGTYINRLAPVAVSGGLTFSQVSAGDSHTCGRTAAGVGYCWGANVWGQLGVATTTEDSSTPVPVDGPA